MPSSSVMDSIWRQTLLANQCDAPTPLTDVLQPSAIAQVRRFHPHDAHSSTKSPDLVGNRRELAQGLAGAKMRGVVRALPE